MGALWRDAWGIVALAGRRAGNRAGLRKDAWAGRRRPLRADTSATVGPPHPVPLSAERTVSDAPPHAPSLMRRASGPVPSPRGVPFEGARLLGSVVGVFVVYGLLAAFLTWPLLPQLGHAVPGSPRSDLWNSLWSVWFAVDAVLQGHLPWIADQLNHPDGGELLVADPLGALVSVPFVPLVGLEAAFGLLVLGRIALAGVVAHGFCWDLSRAAAGDSPSIWLPGPLFAGVAVASAPVLLAGVHNGTSESTAWAPAILAVWACWRAQQRPGQRRVWLAGAALFLATVASAYSAVVAFVLAGMLALDAPSGARWTDRARRLAPLSLGLVLSVPVALLQHGFATRPGNLVGIKSPGELAMVRRSTGAADPWTMLVGGDFRSPDFAEISRYGETFIHTAYFGYVVLGVGLFALVRGPRRWALWAGALSLGLLALGPVWVQDGAAVVFADDRALPLPYFLVERLPGFSSLSLVWRLAQGPALVLAVLGGASLSRRRWLWVLPLLVLVEGRTLSPMRDGLALSDGRVHPAILALAHEPAGAVVNFPVVGGRAYLHEQTAHHHALAATLNFPNNAAGQKFWRKALAELERASGDLSTSKDQAVFARSLGKTARALQVRYVVIHLDPGARPDMHDAAARAIQRAFPAPASEPTTAVSGPHAREVTVHKLY